MAAVAGMSLLFPRSFLTGLWALNPSAAVRFRALGWVPGALLILLGAATLAGGIGSLRGRRWAWWFAVLLFGVNGCGDLASGVVTRDWAKSASGLAVAGVFLFLLSRPAVRRHFITSG